MTDALPARELGEAVLSGLEPHLSTAPWSEIGSDDRVGAVSDLVHALLAAAIGSGLPDLAPICDAACLHAVRRREQGLEESVLFAEYSLVRREAARVIEGRVPGRAGEHMLHHVDRGISHATVAGLRAYNTAPGSA